MVEVNEIYKQLNDFHLQPEDNFGSQSKFPN